MHYSILTISELNTYLSSHFHRSKNKKRKIGKSVIRGRKIDILLKLRNSSREILAGEVVRTGDIHNKKYLTDRMKLLKLMKDMLDLIIHQPQSIITGVCVHLGTTFQ